MNEETLNKTYYSITEVSSMVDVKPYTLRYWEKEFRNINPYKETGGTRRYRKKDIVAILRIKELLHNKKHTIKGAKEMLKQDESEKAPHNHSFKVALETLKYDLIGLKKELEGFLGTE
ncbi:MerR family transcriptional regulator [Chlamydiota bacterium]